MKSLKIFVAKVKESGIEQAEVVCMKVFESIEKTATEVLVDVETTAIEKGAATVLMSVLPALKPQFQKLVDFDRDGQVG